MYRDREARSVIDNALRGKTVDREVEMEYGIRRWSAVVEVRYDSGRCRLP